MKSSINWKHNIKIRMDFVGGYVRYYVCY